VITVAKNYQNSDSCKNLRQIGIYALIGEKPWFFANLYIVSNTIEWGLGFSENKIKNEVF